MKIIIIIGQSASGKTTFVRENFLGTNPILVPEPFPHTLNDNICLLGDYTSNKRCLGTDTLSYTILPTLIEFIQNNIHSWELLVGEGDRINNEKFFKFIASLGLPVELHFFTCSIEDSIKRRENNNSSGSESFVKTTKTKSRNMLGLAEHLGFNIITHDTTTIKGGLDLF